MLEYFLYFLVGGFVVLIGVVLAKFGHPFLGGMTMVFPNLSLVGFYFINKASGDSAVMITIKSSLLGTLIVWPIYMVSLLLLIPKFGVNKSLVFGALIALVSSIIFIVIFKYTSLSSWVN